MEAVGCERWVLEDPPQSPEYARAGPSASSLPQSQSAWVSPSDGQSAATSVCSDLFGRCSQLKARDSVALLSWSSAFCWRLPNGQHNPGM